MKLKENKEKTKKKKIAVYHTLGFRVYAYFMVSMVTLSLLMGIMFLSLYNRDSMKRYSDELMDKAQSVAIRMQEFMSDQDWNNYASYLEILDAIEPSDFWLISKKDATDPMPSRMQNINLEDVVLNEEVDKTLNAAFSGVTAYAVNRNDSIYGEAIMTLGTPIWNKSGEVAGVVLLNSALEGYEGTIRQMEVMMLVTCVTGMVAALILSLFFARGITSPLGQLGDVAYQLAQGDYKVKAKVKGKNELAELASTMNFLSSQLEENEEKRKNMEQMRMDFFANVSHELRTPITVMRGYTETLADGIVEDPQKIQNYYDRMLLECKGMERLVGDLLTLAKMQNPDFVIEREPVDLVQMLEDLIRSMNVVARDKQIHIAFENQMNYCMMEGDYDRLKQMFVVILDNAIKFSSPGKTVIVQLRRTKLLRGDERVVVAITDEGVGISEEELKNIFDKFYKSKLRQNAKGSGLGLIIAREICRKHGGELHVSSSLGVGSTFSFTFVPMTEAETEGLEETGNNGPSSREAEKDMVEMPREEQE